MEREALGAVGDHCGLVIAREGHQRRQACLTRGGTRYISGHWVGHGVRPAFRFRQRAGV